MREMGAQFVLGRTIDEAISNGADARDDGYTFFYDRLGEAARTEDDAQRYHGAYSQAISAISLRAASDDTRENSGISVKLSALHPRYEYGQREDVVPVLAGRVLQLACAAKDGALGFNIDAEEQDRLDLSLDVIEAVVEDINARGYGLTMGLHKRIDGRVQRVFETADIGNLYINRNQIGAVVWSQPFGGEGLSGTGPKAGGPHYLSRFRKAVMEVATSSGGESVVVSASVIQSAFDQIDAEDWSARIDRIGTLRRALRGKAPEAMAAAAALEQGPIDLPGPTGESNRLRLAEKGRVLCLGLTADAALAQAVQALATGNSVVAVAAKFKLAIGPLIEAGLPVAGIDGSADMTAIETLALDAVAATGSADDLAPIRRALAARNGPVLPLISDRISPASYASERALCIDTTAAGGNTALLARVGDEDVS